MIILSIVAFIGGILTAFTPCVLPVLPVVLASGLAKRARTAGVIVGLVSLFVIVTVTLGSLVRSTGISPDTIRLISVGLLIILSIFLIVPALFAKLQFAIERVWHPPQLGAQRGDFIGGFLTGASLGVIWTPCVGPLVGVITALTASTPASLTGWIIALSYGLGIGIALWFIAIQGGKAMQKLSFVRQNMASIQRTFGVIVAITAIFLLFGLDRQLQEWTLQHLPEEWTLAGGFLQDADFVQDEIDTIRQQNRDEESPTQGQAATPPDNTGNSDDSVDSDGDKLDPSELSLGCPGKDCIPSIDNPVFESAQAGDEWLNPEDIVFGVSYNGITRAYPQRILNWHEIVNDRLGDTPVAITFCPLCGTAIAFERVVNGTETTFGVSGKLYNSNLVMYDRLEESYWQQADGQAIIGPAAARDESLDRVPISTVTWERWLSEHPNTQVLSRETGYTRDYSRYPYGTYEENDEIYFGVENTDQRLPLKEVVYGFVVNDQPIALTEKFVLDNPAFSDTIEGESVSLNTTEDGTVTMIVDETGEEIVPLRTFWFAWAAFHPDTRLES